MNGYIAVKDCFGVPRQYPYTVKVTPIETVAKNRYLRHKSREFIVTEQSPQDLPAFQRYLRRLHRIGFTSEYGGMWWMPASIRDSLDLTWSVE